MWWRRIRPESWATDNRSPLIDLDVVLAAAESVLNDTLHFEKIALTHVLRLIRSFTAAEPDTAGPPMATALTAGSEIDISLKMPAFPANLHTFPATLFDYNGVLANDETVHLAAFQGRARAARDHAQRGGLLGEVSGLR